MNGGHRPITAQSTTQNGIDLRSRGPQSASARLRIMGSLLGAALACSGAIADAATTRTAFDGSWDLVFVTRTGGCDPTYNFTVNIANGIVTHPNLVRFTGRVARSGSVRASVGVQDKFASGSGNLTTVSGRGTWSGYSRNVRCSGYWTAQRN